MLLKLALFAIMVGTAFTARCHQNPSTYFFTIGDINGTMLSDGPITFEENVFTVPIEVVRRSYRENFRNPFPLVAGQNVVILDTNAGRVMVDAGASHLLAFPTLREGGQLFRNLKVAGITTKSVDAVLLTHGHPDHVAGLATRKGNAAFPNAKVYVGRVEHDFWISTHPSPSNDTIDGAVIYAKSIAPYQRSGRLRFVRENGTPLPGVKFVPARGHSPGHNVIEVSSRGERLVIVGDAWGAKPDTLQNPEWGLIFDDDQSEAIKNRIALLNRVARR